PASGSAISATGLPARSSAYSMAVPSESLCTQTGPFGLRDTATPLASSSGAGRSATRTGAEHASVPARQAPSRTPRTNAASRMDMTGNVPHGADSANGYAMSDGRIGVLFVCLGNICRSPLAEGVFRHLADAQGFGDRLLIDSAG